MKMKAIPALEYICSQLLIYIYTNQHSNSAEVAGSSAWQNTGRSYCAPKQKHQLVTLTIRLVELYNLKSTF